MEFDLCKIDWVAISAIVTFLMAIAAFWALYENRKQLNELKRQWQEEHKARLNFSIEVQSHFFYLKMGNTGRSVVEIRKVEINEEFLEKMVRPLREHLEAALCSDSLKIAGGMTRYFGLCLRSGDNALSEKDKNDHSLLLSTPLKIKATLVDYSVQEYEFTIQDYLYLANSVPFESDVAKALNEIGKIVQKIHQKLPK